MIESAAVKALVAAGTLAASGWGAHVYLADNYADKGFVLTMNQQTQFVLDLQIESIVKQIAHLEAKDDKTQAEWEQLRYLREQLEIMRRVRRGK